MILLHIASSLQLVMVLVARDGLASTNLLRVVRLF